MSKMSDDSSNKVLLLGSKYSGKTSMRSIIFADSLPRDVSSLGVTHGIEESNVRLLGNMDLNLWDCGGQDDWMSQYFNSMQEDVFRGVEVLIYLFDIMSGDVDTDVYYYQQCLERLMSHTANARVFCLVHKMDLVPAAERKLKYEERVRELEHLSKPLNITCFSTSIWDETLYHAWSSIVTSLIPNISGLQQYISAVCEACEGDEAVVFERTTFLEIASATRGSMADHHRLEKMSNIIKQFKLSCAKGRSSLHSMEVRNQRFVALIEPFTDNTFLMVVSPSEGSMSSAAMRLNIGIAREKLGATLSQNF